MNGPVQKECTFDILIHVLSHVEKIGLNNKEEHSWEGYTWMLEELTMHVGWSGYSVITIINSDEL